MAEIKMFDAHKGTTAVVLKSKNIKHAHWNHNTAVTFAVSF